MATVPRKTIRERITTMSMYRFSPVLIINRRIIPAAREAIRSSATTLSCRYGPLNKRRKASNRASSRITSDMVNVISIILLKNFHYAGLHLLHFLIKLFRITVIHHMNPQPVSFFIIVQGKTPGSHGDKVRQRQDMHLLSRA